jgi:hypothetical protein
VWLDGGPSAQETFDPRPDAPTDLRGPLGSIRTTVPGLAIGALMPRMALQMHRVTLVRTVSHSESIHHRACRKFLTEPTSDTSIGSLACRHDKLPHFIIGDSVFAAGYGQTGPATPVMIRPDSVARLLHHESPRIRAAYGSHRFGQSCLVARRLVEQGARFVTVVHGGWDTHCNAIEAARGWLVPTFDQGLAALLMDLSERGILDRTLVVVAGEFGRSPHLNAMAGRDHSPAAGLALLAGGGVPGGQVIGGVDAATGEPRDVAVAPEQITATILGKLGIRGCTPDPRFC